MFEKQLQIPPPTTTGRILVVRLIADDDNVTRCVMTLERLSCCPHVFVFKYILAQHNCTEDPSQRDLLDDFFGG